MKNSVSALAVGLAFAGASFAAQADEGLYGYLGAGYNMPEDSDLSGAATGDISYDGGIGVLGALGYDYGDYFRTEVELGLRSNDVDDITPPGTGSGDTDVFSTMLNLIFTAPTGAAFEPYLGGGVGFGRVDRDVSAPGVDLDDADFLLAYQGIAGVAFDVMDGLDLDLSYRYFRTQDQDIITPGGEVEAEYAAHGIFAGVRWAFGAPAAPAPQPAAEPVAAPAPALTPVDEAPEDLEIIVYFDLNESVLTAQADSLIRQAATTALENNISVVLVDGHTDTSGSTAYNQVLSERRSAVVREKLTEYGVPAGLIQSSALGESQPAVSTGDGVREPLNRRTEVRISFSE
ncbi:MAG: OmpA family protein [Pseudomonadota bacterium]